MAEAQGRTFSDLFTVKRPSDSYSNRSKSPNAHKEAERKNTTEQVNSFIQRNYHKENKKRTDRELKEKQREEEADRLAREKAIP